MFDVPAKGSSIKLQETLQAHDCGINDLHSYGDQMVSSDDSGTLILWNSGSCFTKHKVIAGYRYLFMFFHYYCYFIRIKNLPNSLVSKYTIYKHGQTKYCYMDISE